MSDNEVNIRRKVIKINTLVVSGKSQACNYEKISPRKPSEE